MLHIIGRVGRQQRNIEYIFFNTSVSKIVHFIGYVLQLYLIFLRGRKLNYFCRKDATLYWPRK